MKQPLRCLRTVGALRPSLWRHRAALLAIRLVARAISLRRVEDAAALVCRVTGWFSAARRQAFAERVETVSHVLAHQRVDASRVRMTGILETLLDWKVYFADPGYREWDSIDRIAQEIRRRIIETRARFPDRPIVLGPFHYASQYVNILVCERLRIHLGMPSLSVVSAVGDDRYGEDDARIPNIRRLYSYRDGKGASRGVIHALRQQRLVVLFADAVPSALSSSPMATVGVELFGRKARIYHGVFRLGAAVDALLLPYYLRFADGRFTLYAFEAIRIREEQAPQRLAADIEQAFAANHAQWLPSDCLNFYYFSPAK